MTTTDRLILSRPTSADLEDLHALQSDPRVWEHYPSLRHTERTQTEDVLARWDTRWDRDGLGTWIIRARDDGRFLGYGGCTILDGAVWNLGYRIVADEHGKGFASEVSRAAIAAAHAHRPGLPVIAYLVEHNVASAAVARRVGMTQVYRGPDTGNPDPTVIRLVFAERPLTDAELAIVMRWS